MEVEMRITAEGEKESNTVTDNDENEGDYNDESEKDEQQKEENNQHEGHVKIISPTISLYEVLKKKS